MGKISTLWLVLAAMGALSVLGSGIGWADDSEYFTISEMTEAQTTAQTRHVPIVWMTITDTSFTVPKPDKNSEPELAQTVLHYLTNDLKGRVVIICINSKTEMDQVPDCVKAELDQYDDGALPDNAYFLNPKLVVTTPNAAKSLGRLSNTQLQSGRTNAIYDVLFKIWNDDQLKAEVLGVSVEKLKAAEAQKSWIPNMSNLGAMSPKVKAIGILVVIVVLVLVIIMIGRARSA